MRRYPNTLTQMQRRMMRAVEVNPFYEDRATKREKARIATLVQKGYLRARLGGGLEPAGHVEYLTVFVRERLEGGPVKIARLALTKPSPLRAAEGLLGRLQAGNPRPLRLLGYFRDDRAVELHTTLHPHALDHGWFKPHPDVLALTKHRTFEPI